eukprot:8570075-Alexandrium_andersonii.AAC.1
MWDLGPRDTLSNDADIWAAIGVQLRRRGRGSFRLKKVRAHLLERDFALGHISAADWWGNQCADSAARGAANLVHAWKSWMAPYLVRRSDELRLLITMVQKTMARILLTAAELGIAQPP